MRSARGWVSSNTRRSVPCPDLLAGCGIKVTTRGSPLGRRQSRTGLGGGVRAGEDSRWRCVPLANLSPSILRRAAQPALDSREPAAHVEPPRHPARPDSDACVRPDGALTNQRPVASAEAPSACRPAPLHQSGGPARLAGTSTTTILARSPCANAECRISPCSSRPTALRPRARRSRRLAHFDPARRCAPNLPPAWMVTCGHSFMFMFVRPMPAAVGPEKAAVRLEPRDAGFADLCLASWLCVRGV